MLSREVILNVFRSVILYPKVLAYSDLLLLKVSGFSLQVHDRSLSCPMINWYILLTS